jgi:hypothetical protein
MLDHKPKISGQVNANLVIIYMDLFTFKGWYNKSRNFSITYNLFAEKSLLLLSLQFSSLPVDHYSLSAGVIV